jgi:site-specific recombinase XerD
LVQQTTQARTWLKIQDDLGLASATIDAYGRALEDYLRFLAGIGIDPQAVTREHVARYVGDLRSRPGRRGADGPAVGLSSATLQQRLTAARLFHDFLVEEGLRASNPVGRGRYKPGRVYASRSERGLVPRTHALPWIPTDEEWHAVLDAARAEPPRNRLMLAVAYDAALRREELCSLELRDLDPAHRLLTVRAETTKNRQGRVVPYSAATGALLRAYLPERRALSPAAGPLFLSLSRRNRGRPLSIWTWSKVVGGIAARSGVRRFTTHTLRHLCLTDLARAGWDIRAIAQFAGHRSTETTMRYIHLSGRDLAAKLERGMAQIHAWRAATLAEVLG